jgi:hypothetical protein
MTYGKWESIGLTLWFLGILPGAAGLFGGWLIWG